jgi:hypothetical protein
MSALPPKADMLGVGVDVGKVPQPDSCSATNQLLNHRISAGQQRKGHSEAERFGVPHFLATQYLRTKGIKPQFPNGIVSSVSFVSTTNTARSLAGFDLLALALTPAVAGQLGEALSALVGLAKLRKPDQARKP